MIIVGIPKYKNIFAEGYTPNWSEEVFMIKKEKNTVRWTYVISDLSGKKVLEHFVNKSCKMQAKKNSGLKKKK